MPNELQVPYDVYRKIFCYAEITAKDGNEVMFLLKLREPDDGGLLVEDVILPEQEVGSATCELKTGKWMKSIKKDDWQYIRGWGHSHKTMGCFHSGTDDDTLEDKWNGESKNSSPYGVSLVVSLPHDMKAWITYYKPFLLKKVEIPISILNPPANDIMMKACETEVKDRVKKWSYKQNFPYGNLRDPTGNPCSAGSSNQQITSAASKLFDEEDEDDLSPEETIRDQFNGYSIAELKEYGMWDEEVYADLVDELKKANAKLKQTKAVEYVNEKPCECPHLSLNGKDRWICFFSGKIFDCNKCKHKPMPAPPVVLPLPPPASADSSSPINSPSAHVIGPS